MKVGSIALRGERNLNLVVWHVYSHPAFPSAPISCRPLMAPKRIPRPGRLTVALLLTFSLLDECKVFLYLLSGTAPKATREPPDRLQGLVYYSEPGHDQSAGRFMAALLLISYVLPRALGPAQTIP
jgi:hypothetical protein